jgi:hypothetical protein
VNYSTHCRKRLEASTSVSTTVVITAVLHSMHMCRGSAGCSPRAREQGDLSGARPLNRGCTEASAMVIGRRQSVKVTVDGHQ